MSNVKRCCGIPSTGKIIWSCYLGWTNPPTLCDVLSSSKCRQYFLLLFFPHLFCGCICCFLDLNSSFAFYSPLLLAEILLFCFMSATTSIKTSRFPTSQLALISSSFNPHCAFLFLLWHFTHLTLCYGRLISFMRLWTTWVLYVEKVLIRCLLNWVPEFSLSARHSVDVLHQMLAMSRTLFLFPSNLFALLTSLLQNLFKVLQFFRYTEIYLLFHKWQIFAWNLAVI